MDRRWLWLLAAGVLVIAAAWLVRIPEAGSPFARPDVEMPRQLRPVERERMLAVTVWVRSAALSAAAGASLILLGLLATHRVAILDLMGRGLGRALFAGLTAVVPPLGRLADAAGALASSGPLAPGGLVRLLAGTVAFSAALLAVAVWRFDRRDF